MAAASSIVSFSNHNELLWKLAFQISQLCDRQLTSPEDARQLVAELQQHPLHRAVEDALPHTLAWSLQADQVSQINEGLSQIFMRWLSALEDNAAQVAVQLSCDREVLEEIRQTLHRVLMKDLNEGLAEADDRQRFEQAMYHFAYGLSHEINNPLANIMARASMLAADETTVSKRKSLLKIVESANRAHEMLAEMMLAVQCPTLKLRRLDLRRLLASASVGWSEKVRHHQLVWTAVLCDDFLWCKADGDSLREALSAVIQNSIDSCRAGDGVNLVADRVENSGGELEIRVAILDNGPGLSDEAMNRAWDIYYSGREAGRGLGIGLCKAKRIIESHNGRVWLESKSKAGCSLEIRLPWDRLD